MIYVAITLGLFAVGFIISKLEAKHNEKKRRAAIKERGQRAVRYKY